ncbi:hypothetical protein HAX54_003191 [Datura stramonium]|uniref:Uncharacterized protein n=1 Tax=Datura stramonium TaxID=4076 RepID=A0ABS8WU43_DATST|nr:hypothetical protein [Datura stramonium]
MFESLTYVLKWRAKDAPLGTAGPGLRKNACGDGMGKSCTSARQARKCHGVGKTRKTENILSAYAGMRAGPRHGRAFRMTNDPSLSILRPGLHGLNTNRPRFVRPVRLQPLGFGKFREDVALH